MGDSFNGAFSQGRPAGPSLPGGRRARPAQRSPHTERGATPRLRDERFVRVLLPSTQPGGEFSVKRTGSLAVMLSVRFYRIVVTPQPPLASTKGLREPLAKNSKRYSGLKGDRQSSCIFLTAMFEITFILTLFI